MDKLEEVRDSVVVFGKRGQGWGCKVQKPRHRKQGRPVRICHVHVTWQSSTGQWAHCITNNPPTTVDWLADARFLGSSCFPTKAERSTAAILVIIKVIPFFHSTRQRLLPAVFSEQPRPPAPRTRPDLTKPSSLAHRPESTNHNNIPSVYSSTQPNRQDG